MFLHYWLIDVVADRCSGIFTIIILQVFISYKEIAMISVHFED